MNNLPPAIQQALAPFAPKPAVSVVINDDDIYIAEYAGKHGWQIVKNLGCAGASASANVATQGMQTVHVGQALFRGMTLKGLL